jgi:hypothetical protein
LKLISSFRKIGSRQSGGRKTWENSQKIVENLGRQGCELEWILEQKIWGGNF